MAAKGSSPDKSDEDLSPTNYLALLQADLESTVAGAQNREGGSVASVAEGATSSIFKRLSLGGRSAARSKPEGVVDALSSAAAAAASAGGSSSSSSCCSGGGGGQIVYMAIGRHTAGKQSSATPFVEVSLGGDGEAEATAWGRELLKASGGGGGNSSTWEELARGEWCSLKWPVVDGEGLVTAYVCVFKLKGSADSSDSNSNSDPLVVVVHGCARAAMTKLALIVGPMLFDADVDASDAAVAAASEGSGNKRGGFFGGAASAAASLYSRSSRRRRSGVDAETASMVRLIVERELETSNRLAAKELADLNAISSGELQNLQWAVLYPDARRPCTTPFPRRSCHRAAAAAAAAAAAVGPQPPRCAQARSWATFWPRLRPLARALSAGASARTGSSRRACRAWSST